MTKIEKATPRTLYIRRDVLNAKDIIAWAKKEGFTSTLEASDMHVTIMFSRCKVDWMKIPTAWEEKMTIPKGGPRMLERLGPMGDAAVLMFNHYELQWRHKALKELGCSWEWSEYQPHITISYKQKELDISKLQPYKGPIVLGPEIFEEVNEKWMANVKEKSIQKFNVTKVDTKLGVVFGWGIICKKDGVEYYDLQGDHIPEGTMLKATVDFVQNSRVSKEMHAGEELPNSMFVFPMTTDIAKAYGFPTENTGMMVMYKPTPEALAKFESGEYTGFSIGGEVIEAE